MGRTNPTHRDVLRATEARWADYRRVLRRRDREHFDALFEHARAHADAGGYRNHSEPMVSVLVAVVLEHERRLAALEGGPGTEDERVRGDGTKPEEGDRGAAAIGKEER